MNVLKGYLTYLVAFTGIFWGIGGFITGQLDADTAMTAVWAGLGLFGLRRAMPGAGF